MPSTPTLLIVGGGLAGAKGAEAARSGGYEGRIVLLGTESRLPYERPPLSKTVLRAEADPESSRVHDHDFYAQNSITVITGDTVEELDVGAREARLSNGGSIAFDTAVLTTGAQPRQLELPGAQLAGVHYLRTVDDSVRLHSAIKNAGRVAVIGAGWIGSEVAASARQMGAEVVLIEPLAVPLQRVLGTRVGEMFQQLHSDHGVRLRLGSGVSELRGGGSVEQLVLSDGSVEDADVVVVGIGVNPQTELARAAGLDIDNGVVVNELLQTSAPHVFAAGDVANAWHRRYGRHLRIEHWANALNQGAAAGANAASEPVPYTRLPYFYSDQYDLGLEYVGFADANDAVAIRGDLAKREFIAFYHQDGVVTAGLAVNIWDVVEDLRTIINAAAPVDLARLSDPDVALADLVPAGG